MYDTLLKYSSIFKAGARAARSPSAFSQHHLAVVV